MVRNISQLKDSVRSKTVILFCLCRCTFSSHSVPLMSQACSLLQVPSFKVLFLLVFVCLYSFTIGTDFVYLLKRLPIQNLLLLFFYSVFFVNLVLDVSELLYYFLNLKQNMNHPLKLVPYSVNFLSNSS